MIRIFYGDGRITAKREITKILGDSYETIEGSSIEPDQLSDIFLGNSLFTDSRSILIQDLSTNKLAFEQLPNYINTSHEVIILESKLDKRSSIYKELKNKIEIREFTLPKDQNAGLVFDIYDLAKRDGAKAIRELQKIKLTEEPIKFAGLLNSRALKDFSRKQGNKEKRVLKELSKLDIELKTSNLDQWLLIEAFLFKLSSL